MKRPITIAALPLFFVAGLAAQEPASTTSKPSQPAPRPGATAQQPTTTLTGCLYREDQIPGRKPNVAEKAGVMEDYILAGATMADERCQTRRNARSNGHQRDGAEQR